MIHERTRENADFDADQHFSLQFLCLTCKCWFYCKEEMVAHFGSLHPTELRQCSLCPEQVCGPDEIFNKHLEFHKAVDINDLELMMDLTSTHTMEIKDPEYAILSFGEVTPEFIENAKGVLDSKLHDKIKQFVYIKPDMTLKVLFELQNFVFSHVPDKRVKCEVCSKFIRDFPKHMTEEHPPPKHACPHCDVMVEDNAVKVHLKKAHRGGKLLYCKICDSEYRTTYLEQPHMIPKSIKVVTCPLEACKRMFLNQDRLTTHMKRIHKVKEVIIKPSEPSGPVLCDLCGRVLKNKFGLLMHLNRAHFSEKNKDNAIHVCDTCGKVVDSKLKLRRHLIRCQGEKIPCDICGKKFVRDDMYAHKKSHLQLDDSQKHACKYCGKKYALRFRCRAHESTHEGAELKCTICKPRQYFKTLKAATEHREKHERGETFTLPPHMLSKQCPLCSLVLKNQRNLNIHLKVHARKGSDAQPKKGGRFGIKVLELACYVCLVRYGSQQQFDEHMEAYHPHGVPTPDPLKVLAKSFSYQCSFCPKKMKNLQQVITALQPLHRGKM
ncbi:hypothetical protein B566_EDAN013443 [Ephemera danica]|nr:hypothetical protein B566_EDAN013443 [Ephemera danica]